MHRDLPPEGGTPNPETRSDYELRPCVMRSLPSEVRVPTAQDIFLELARGRLR
jgi:hypothetical protein